MMYKKIALAADGSENALRAAKQAANIAKMMGSQIEVLYVADFSKAKNEVLHTTGRTAREQMRRERIQPVEEKLRESNIEYTIKILHGEPGPAIIEYVNGQSFDLIVLGSRGLNSLQEMVLGSVSHKVVKRANAPVMIVK